MNREKPLKTEHSFHKKYVCCIPQKGDSCLCAHKNKLSQMNYVLLFVDGVREYQLLGSPPCKKRKNFQRFVAMFTIVRFMIFYKIRCIACFQGRVGMSRLTATFVLRLLTQRLCTTNDLSANESWERGTLLL